MIDERGLLIEYFPIARFICRKKGKVKSRTFSLLPWQLIPYRKYMIDFVLAVASYQIKHSINQTLDHFHPKIKESSHLHRFKKLLSESLEKLKISKMLSYEINFKSFIDYCLNYTSTRLSNHVSESDEMIRGPTGLSCYYYRKNGGYYENSQFLFGCAAQFC